MNTGKKVYLSEGSLSPKVIGVIEDNIFEKQGVTIIKTPKKDFAVPTDSLFAATLNGETVLCLTQLDIEGL
jgi:hypothetical protein